jgi:hypothetical protein
MRAVAQSRRFLARNRRLACLRHDQERDGVVLVVEDLTLRDAAFREGGGQRLHVGVIPVNQPPVHERFHVTAVADRAEEVGDEHDATRLRHLEHAMRERGGDRASQIVEEPGSVDEVELAELHLAGEDLADRSFDRADAEAPVVARDDCETRRILIDGDEFCELPLLYGGRKLDFAKVAGGDREHARRAVRRHAIDHLRDQLPAIPDGFRRRTRAHIGEDGAAERGRAPSRFARLAEPVDIVHHHGVAGVAARFGERAMREWILVEQIAKRMIQTLTGIFRPGAGLVGPPRAQVLEQLVHGLGDVSVVEPIPGEIQRGTAKDLRCIARGDGQG